jgi:uncharacterized protein YeaC (DUF1315 family)
MNKDIKMVQDNGQTFRVVQITPEQIENLRMLVNHPGWRDYKRILEAQRDNTFIGLMSAEANETKYAKRIGTAEGLHLAAITLDGLIRDFENKAKRVAEGSKNQPEHNG